jgi:hypothetical protein
MDQEQQWQDLSEDDIMEIVKSANLGHPSLIPPYTKWLFQQVALKLKEKNGYS